MFEPDLDPFLPFELEMVTLSPNIRGRTALEATPGQIDGFFSQLPFKCYLPEEASVGD